MVDIRATKGKMVFLLKVFVGVLLSCFQSVFQRELELLNSVDILSLSNVLMSAKGFVCPYACSCFVL